MPYKITSLPSYGFQINQEIASEIAQWQKNHIADAHKGENIDDWSFEFIPSQKIASCKCRTCYNKAISFKRPIDNKTSFSWKEE